jgi:1-acyl-sn-glycerol-3-phosphate acyltransferase
MKNILIKIKIFILFICVFIYLGIYITLPKMMTTIIFNNGFEWFINLLNLKIKIHGDIIPEEKVIYVCNHVSNVDYFVVKKILLKYRRTLYTIVNENMVNVKGYIKILLYNIKHIFYNSLNFICYKFGNKESGSNVKSKVLKLFEQEDCNLLIFPSGHVSNNEVLSFKPGIFKLAAENNIKIRPISLKYNRPILLQNSSQNFSLEEWFNLNVDVYIHDIQSNNNWETLMNDCYNLVCKPLKFDI